jgi:hypothetical protein
MGCSTSNYYQYGTYSISDYSSSILGLPVVFDGITSSNECIARTEKKIDEKMIGLWKSKYIPISQGKKEYKSLIDELTTHLSSPSEAALKLNPELILENKKELCEKIIETTGCRYVIFPRCTISDMTSQLTLASLCIIPIPPVTILPGIIPIPLETKKEKALVYTLTLIDLKKNLILAREVLASKEDVKSECLEYPADIIENIAVGQIEERENPE